MSLIVFIQNLINKILNKNTIQYPKDIINRYLSKIEHKTTLLNKILNLYKYVCFNSSTTTNLIFIKKNVIVAKNDSLFISINLINKLLN